MNGMQITSQIRIPPLFFFQNEVNGVPPVNFPKVCTNETAPEKAFSILHCEFCMEQELTITTNLREFFSFSGNCQFDLIEPLTLSIYFRLQF